MAPIAAPLLFLNAFIFPNILFISMEKHFECDNCKKKYFESGYKNQYYR